MLIGMNIITPKCIDLVILERTGYINSCWTTFELAIIPPTRPFIKRDVLLGALVYIPVHSNIAVTIDHIDLPAGDDFMFEPITYCPVALFASVVDSSFHAVLVRNDLD